MCHSYGGRSVCNWVLSGRLPPLCWVLCRKPKHDPAEESKRLGNNAYKDSDYGTAIEHYTQVFVPWVLAFVVLVHCLQRTAVLKNPPPLFFFC